MGYVKFKLEKYSVRLSPQEKEIKIGDTTAKLIATISCSGKHDGSLHMANLMFLAENSPTPKDYIDLNTFQGQFFIPYKLHQKFEWFLDILRNERPVYFYLSETPGDSYLYTGDEPVGDEESPLLFGWF